VARGILIIIVIIIIIIIHNNNSQQYSHNRSGSYGFVYWGAKPDLIGVQVVYSIVLVVWVSATSLLLFGSLRFFEVLRLSEDIERMGMDPLDLLAVPPLLSSSTTRMVAILASRANRASLRPSADDAAPPIRRTSLFGRSESSNRRTSFFANRRASLDRADEARAAGEIEAGAKRV
jgi:hypothetical protein